MDAICPNPKPGLSRLTEYLFYLFVFLLPLQTRLIIKPGILNGGYFEYGTYSIYISDLLLVFIFIALAINCIQRINNAKFNPLNNGQSSKFWKDKSYHERAPKVLLFFITLFILSAFLSIFFAIDKSLAGYAFIRLIFGIGVFGLAVFLNYDKLTLAFSFLAGVFLEALLGTWQFAAQSGFAFKWLGLASHDPSVLGTAVVETVSGRWLRAYGGLDHPNILAGTLAIALLLGVSIYIFSSFNNQHNYRKIKIFLLLTSYFLLLISLFFTFSRSGWIAFSAGLSAIAVFVLFSRKWEILKKLALVLAFGSIVLLPAAYFCREIALTRLESASRLEQISINERAGQISDSLQIIRSNMLFGTGIGNYTLAVNKIINGKMPAYAYQPVHNGFLLVFAEQGLLGLSSLALLILLIVYFMADKRFFNRAMWKTDRHCFLNYSIFISFLIALAIIMLFDHWLFSLHYGIFLFWLIMGLAIKNIFFVKSTNNSINFQFE